MKNKYEDYCYVCGELVLEEAGVAEQRARQPGGPGWGKTVWVVRHTDCRPTKDANDTRRSTSKDGENK
jgi:hypothetical protein